MKSVRVSFGKYLQDKSNFIRVGTVGIGVPAAVGLLWMFGGHGGVGWWLYLVVLAFGGGWLWAVFMWLVFKNDIQRMSPDSTAQKVDKQAGKPGSV